MSCVHIQYFLKLPLQFSLSLTEKEGGDAPSLLIQALKSSNKLSHMKICWLVWLARLPVNTVCCALQVLSHRQLPNKYNLWPQAGKRCQACQQKASCSVPQRTPHTTNCYRLMAPFNTKNLLHRHPLCNPSFPMLCSHCSVALKRFSAPPVNMCLGRIVIQGEILASSKASGH